VASSRAFDLVLCDIGLPGQSGLDMPRALRDRGYRGKLILMTGWDSHALSADPRLAECDALLKKPFVGVDLINAIRSLIATDSAAT
jgi:DNA-binding response OmpR family regulator